MELVEHESKENLKSSPGSTANPFLSEISLRTSTNYTVHSLTETKDGR